MYLFKYALSCEQDFLVFIFCPELSDIWINRNQNSKGLLYLIQRETFLANRKDCSLFIAQP
jgi:hypothetical protein